MSSSQPKLLIIGAHPDDAEIHGGGIACKYRELNRTVKMVSVTDGSAGHHWRTREELIELRRAEAAASGKLIGASYETWDFPDGSLEPNLKVRERIISEIREFQPDLVLTHRTCDYHPDHRAVGQCVQDASYMVTVPHVVAEVPALRKDPVIAYLPDLFTRPSPMRIDVVMDISSHLDMVARMLACHRTQLFEWLAYHENILDSVPDDEADKVRWVRDWLEQYVGQRRRQFRDEISSLCSDSATLSDFVECFEISEYARQPNRDDLLQLFPGALFAS